MWLLLFIIALPIIEIALFIKVGGLIGVWPTLGLVILSVVLGLSLIRAQGLNALGRLQALVSAGEDPSGPIADAAMLLLAGLLLVIPGFLTDALGLILLLPAARATLLRRAAGRLRTRSFVFARTASGAARTQRPDTIEGAYEVLDDVPPAQRGASGWTRGQS